MKPPIVLLQERDFGQKINATFDFIVQNFKPLMLAVLYIAGPPALIGGFFMGSYQSGILDIVKQSSETQLEGLITTFTSVGFLALFLGIASLAATLAVNAYMLEYEDGHRDITPEMVWNRMKDYILKSIGFSIVMFFLVMIGFLFFVIPGMYLAIALSLMYMVMMRENLDLGDTFRRCFYLIKDKWWSTFGLLIVTGIISGIIVYIFQIPTLIVTLSSVLQIGDGMNEIWSTVGGVIATVGSVLVRTLVLVAIAFQYYNLVERREGTGILGAIDNIGKTDTPRTDLREEEF
ncbi:MAG: hypothetical protein R2822_04265 [Spirosomataceae bacterium]